MESALEMPDEFRYLSVQFKIEHDRLRDFGQAAGFAEAVAQDDLSPKIRSKNDLLLSILTEIKKVLEDFTRSNARGDDESHPTQSSEQKEFGEMYTSITNNIVAPEKPATGAYHRLKWGIFDKDNFIGLLQRLRQSNDYLHKLLDECQISKLQRAQQETNMELVQVRSSVADLTTLAEASESLRRSSGQPTTWQQKAVLELENLVTFKILYASLLEKTISSKGGLNIPSSHIRYQSTPMTNASHVQASWTPEKSPSSTVWISWHNHEVPEEGPERTWLAPIEELTALLTAPKPDEFCVPPCLGYCDFGPESEHRLGLIFKNPPHVDPNVLPQCLMQAILSTPKPSLTRRIALASRIAQCLLYLHSVNWLHKGLRSENILFFPS